MLPNLEFDSSHYNHQTFSEDVSRTLILHKAPFLESLKLEVGYECDALEIGLLVGIAFARHVRKLVLCTALIQHAPELVEAKITNVSEIFNENILETLITAKRLSLDLSPLQIKYPIGKIFYQLLSLDLHTNKEGWWYLLSFMLDSSPKLQILKLIDPYHYHIKDSPFGWKWSQPKRVPECFLFHLETFEWTGYEWQLEDEKEVATYILKNARRLKKATLSTKPIESKELEKLEKRREMLNQLATEARASDSCHLVIEAETS